MSDTAKQFPEVHAAIKAGMRTIDNQIKLLQKKRAAMQAVIGSSNGAATTGAAKTKGTTPKAKTGEKGPGMLNVLLPFMEGKPQVTSVELLTQLRKHPHYKDATAGVLAAALSTELKKDKRRVDRVSKGVYRVSASYFEQSQPTRPSPVDATTTETQAEPAEATA